MERRHSQDKGQARSDWAVLGRGSGQWRSQGCGGTDLSPEMLPLPSLLGGLAMMGPPWN